MAVWTQPVWAEVVILDRWTVACLFASSERKALLSQRPRSPQGRPSGAGTHADAKDGQRWRLLTYARDCRYQIAPFARAAGAWGCDRACMDERVQHEANGCVSLKPFPHYDSDADSAPPRLPTGSVSICKTLPWLSITSRACQSQEAQVHLEVCRWNALFAEQVRIQVCGGIR